MDESFEKLCVNCVLKPEHQHLNAKGLTDIPHMLWDFQIKWIRFNHVYNGQLWLEQPILITKKMILRIIGLPMLEKTKMTKTLSQVKLEKKKLGQVGWKGNEYKKYNWYGAEIW